MHLDREPGQLVARLAKLLSIALPQFPTLQTPVMKYNRQLMQAIMWDRINIAEVVGV